QNSLSRQLAEWEVTHDGVRERNRRISDTMPLTLTADHRFRHSFPTRRSSDLDVVEKHKPGADVRPLVEHDCQARDRGVRGIDTNRLDGRRDIRDRKSTRLNSSHVEISYAVFCLKKKKKNKKSSLKSVKTSQRHL